MKISTLVLFALLSLLGCASPSSETTTDVGLKFDVENPDKDMSVDKEDADSSPSDLSTQDANQDSGVDFDRDEYEKCFEEVVAIGEVESEILNEISGIARSRNQEIIWVHNDSGDEDGQFYAIDLEGKLRGTFVLNGAKSDDWEDMAIVELEGTSYLYFGDTGDNAARSGAEGRPRTRVYRVEEPVVDLSKDPALPQSLGGYETYLFTYPEGATDCEALFVDPKTADLFFLEKRNVGKVHFFHAPKPANGSSTELTKLVGMDIPTDEYPGSMTTAGSISADRSWIVVKTYTSVLLFPWLGEATFSEAVSIPPMILPVPREIQGESIDFAEVDSTYGVMTISEGKTPAINFIKDVCK